MLLLLENKLQPKFSPEFNFHICSYLPQVAQLGMHFYDSLTHRYAPPAMNDTILMKEWKRKRKKKKNPQHPIGYEPMTCGS